MVITMNKWQGKVAIVTGASAGIGAAISEALVNVGLKVVGLGRRKGRIAQLAKKLEGKSGKLYPIKVDMTKEEDILEAFLWVKENLGPVHILINNAGIASNTNLIEGNTKKWKEIIDTNVLGLSIATREAIKDMTANNINGHVVHINSTAGHKVPPFPNLSVYPASKFAVTALTETLRQELNSIGSKIKTTSISPGAVATEIGKTSGLTFTKEMEEHLKTYPMLQSQDIADAVIFVLSTPPNVQIQELTLKPVGEII